MNTTERGFQIIIKEDLYGQQFSIQKSSLATKDAIWFGLSIPNPLILASDAWGLGIPTNKTSGWVPYRIPEEVHINTRMHLSREQVKDILPILQKFAETGDL